MGCSEFDPATKERRPWNTGRRLGAKRALKPQQVWAIRFWLDRERRLRDRAMFDLAIDSKLRGCDVVKVKIGDLVSGGRVRSRAIVVQQKTSRPVQFELLEPSRGSILARLKCRCGTLDEFVFPSRIVTPIISALGSMPGSSTNGSPGSDSVRRITAPIHSAGRKRLSSTSRRETYAPCRFCSVIRRSRARSATSASISRMRSPSLRARRCSI